jgi:hypothetical protein
MKLPELSHSRAPVPELITVLIPTRERADTLEHCLTTCSNQSDRNFRILVSDNASEDATKAVVEKFRARDNRVEYINPKCRLGMSEHWEFALGHIRNGFVTVLGDDDALFPDALPTLRGILESWPGTKAISWPYSFYGYPSLFTPSRNHLGLEFERSEVRKSRDWLEKLAAFEVSYFDLPMVYYGVVHASVLDEIRARTGRLISSFIPDVYLAVAVACVTESYYRVSRSLSLCGTSHHSNGAAAMALGEGSSIVRSFLSETQMTTHSKVPYFPSIPAFVLESLFCAREVGLLPDGLKIGFEKAVTRIFLELHAAEHPNDVLEEYLGRLRKLCGGIDQISHLDWLISLDLRARQALAERLAVSDGYPRDHILINVANTPVKDVASAAALASVLSGNEALQQSWRQTSNEMREIRAAFSNQLDQLRELEALARQQENKFETQHLEFLERIASIGRELEQTHAESTSRFHQIEELTELLKISEKDRADRLEQIEQLAALIKISEKDRSDGLARIHKLDLLVRAQRKELEMRQADSDTRLALLAQELEKARSAPASPLH